MPREPYGYAHIKNNAGLVVLRNPWIAPQSYQFKLDESLGFSPAAKSLSAVSLYPEPRLYAGNLKFGDTLEVALAPYETVVLSLNTDQRLSDIPRAASSIRSQLTVTACKHQLQRIAIPQSGTVGGPDWTRRLGGVASAVRLTCDANIRVTAPQAELLILDEGKGTSPTPVGRLTVGGRAVNMDEVSSDAGWSATVLPHHEHWTFLRASLAGGDNTISLEQFVGDDCTRISAWICATKPGNSSKYPNALPQPESLSLDGVALMTPTDVASLP